MAPIDFDADIDYTLEDSGVEIEYGVSPVQRGYGHFDRDSVQAEGDGGGLQLVGRLQSIVVRHDKFTNLRHDAEITVAGVVYVITDPGVPETDGTRRIFLVRKPA